MSRRRSRNARVPPMPTARSRDAIGESKDPLAEPSRMMTTADGLMYHGGAPGLKPGDVLVPADVVGKSLTPQLAPNYRSDRVYVTPTRWLAALYALFYSVRALSVANSAEEGCVYEVRPHGALERDPGQGDGYTTRAASVVSVAGGLCPCDSGRELRSCHTDEAAAAFRACEGLPIGEARQRLKAAVMRWQIDGPLRIAAIERLAPHTVLGVLPLFKTVLAAATTHALISSVHGPDHWDNVGCHAVQIATCEPDVDGDVALAFALIHDAFRNSDSDDPCHGVRAADWVLDHASALGDVDIETLAIALRYHADGLTSSNPTIGACWDADRLDLTRVGITPDAALMSTSTGTTLARALNSRMPLAAALINS